MKDLIRHILKEVVEKRYQKPTPNIEKLIYDWLNNYFSGSEMYHIKSWESRHDFEFCKDGKLIMNVVLYFNVDDTVFDDRRKTENRNFESGSLSIPKDIVNELASDIPVRRAYIKYIIEEWFDDTYLGEIQGKMKRTDVQIDHFNEYPEKADVCVPPITKPEDVTLKQMIDYLHLNTMFGMNQLLQKSPEWIEKAYLDKLRSNEIDRLRR